MGLRGPKIGSTMERKRRHAIDEHAFDDYSPEACYWLGIMAADGCVQFAKGRRKPLIAYGTVDIEHAYKFRDFMKSEHAITLRDRTNRFGTSKSALFQFTSEHVGELMIKNGITPKKTFTLFVSDRLAKSPDFWRGVIDGDGAICISRKYGQPTIVLGSASLIFLEQFCSFCSGLGLRPLIRLATNSNKVGKAPLYSVSFSSAQAIILVKALYFKSCISMDRKQAKAEEVLSGAPRRQHVRKSSPSCETRYAENVVQ